MRNSAVRDNEPNIWKRGAAGYAGVEGNARDEFIRLLKRIHMR